MFAQLPPVVVHATQELGPGVGEKHTRPGQQVFVSTLSDPPQIPSFAHSPASRGTSPPSTGPLSTGSRSTGAPPSAAAFASGTAASSEAAVGAGGAVGESLPDGSMNVPQATSPASANPAAATTLELRIGRSCIGARAYHRGMALRSGWLVFPLAVFVGIAAACTHEVTHEAGDDDDDSDAGSNSGLGVLTFKPAVMYSGFDGTNPYQVPFAVYDYGDDVEVTASPANAVTLEPKTLVNPVGPTGEDKGKYYFATTKAAGDVTLTVKSKGKTASGTLHIAAYEASAWTVGQKRYETAADADNPACATCHEGAQGIDHSPAALATVDDSGVSTVFTTGISPGGFQIKISGQPGHRWKVTDAEKAGLIVYLRGLTPKGFK